MKLRNRTDAPEVKRAQAHNELAWDRLVEQGSAFAAPATREDFREPSRIINPFGWLPGNLHDLQVLCLAAGGGKHGPLFASRGARVTVVDLSERMLELDRRIARREGLSLDTLHASMDDLDALADGRFDIVLQPVSSCYAENIHAVYHEVARIMRPGGIYVSQHKQPVSLQADPHPGPEGTYALREIYHRENPLPPQDLSSAHREAGTLEFIHTLEDILGGLCREGFHIDAVHEPVHADPAAPPGSFGDRSRYIPPLPRHPGHTPGCKHSPDTNSMSIRTVCASRFRIGTIPIMAMVPVPGSRFA